MKLYHFSDSDLDCLRVDRFGDNNYTVRDTRLGVKRIFFYLEPKPLETQIFKHAKYMYVVDIDDSRVYDLRKDKKRIFNKFYMNKSALLEYCRKNFDCIIYSTEIDIDVANVFRDIRPIQKINRRA